MSLRGGSQPVWHIRISRRRGTTGQNQGARGHRRHLAGRCRSRRRAQECPHRRSMATMSKSSGFSEQRAANVATADSARAAGEHRRHHFPDRGIKGNTHTTMMDKNNGEVAANSSSARRQGTRPVTRWISRPRGTARTRLGGASQSREICTGPYIRGDHDNRAGTTHRPSGRRYDFRRFPGDFEPVTCLPEGGGPGNSL